MCSYYTELYYQYLKHVALWTFIFLDGCVFQLVKLELGEKDVIRNVVRSPESAARLVVGEDRLEAGSVPVKEQFTPLGVVELTTANDITKQCHRMTVKHSQTRLEALSAHVDANPSAAGSPTVVLVVATVTAECWRRATVLVAGRSWSLRCGRGWTRSADERRRWDERRLVAVHRRHRDCPVVEEGRHWRGRRRQQQTRAIVADRRRRLASSSA